MVFGRGVQWRHCRYLPAPLKGSPLATSCCCRLRLCPDLTSGALSAAATYILQLEEDLAEASIWNEFLAVQNSSIGDLVTH